MNPNSKTKLFLSILTFFILVFYSACVIDDTTPNPILPHNYASFDALFKDSVFQIKTQTVNAGALIDFNSDLNTNVNIQENTLVFPNGDIATGAVEMQFIELLTKSDLVMSGLSLSENDGTVLELVGGFSITAWKNSEPLELNGPLNLKFNNPGALTNPGGALSVYYSSANNSPLELAADQSSVTLAGSQYQLYGTQIGWVMAAQDFVPNNGTTSLTLNSNLHETEVMEERAFVVFNEFKGMVALPKNGTTFSALGLPIGQSATVVMMAFDETKFYLDTEVITITENQQLDMSLKGNRVEDFITLLKAID